MTIVNNAASLSVILESAIKAGSHCGDYRSKLVHFEGQKIYSTFKKALA